MLISTHLLGTLAVTKILPVNTPELYIALLAGVGVDADHFFVNRKWVQDIKDFIKNRKITYGTNQHSWLQEVFFGFFLSIIIGFAISYFWPVIRWWVFPVFLLLHIAMDAVMKYEHQPFAPLSRYKYWGWLRSATKYELVISLAGLFLLFILY